MIISKRDEIVMIAAKVRQGTNDLPGFSLNIIEANARLFDELWSSQMPGSRRTYRPLPGWRPANEYRCVLEGTIVLPPTQSPEAK